MFQPVDEGGWTKCWKGLGNSKSTPTHRPVSIAEPFFTSRRNQELLDKWEERARLNRMENGVAVPIVINPNVSGSFN